MGVAFSSVVAIECVINLVAHGCSYCCSCWMVDSTSNIGTVKCSAMHSWFTLAVAIMWMLVVLTTGLVISCAAWSSLAFRQTWFVQSNVHNQSDCSWWDFFKPVGWLHCTNKYLFLVTVSSSSVSSGITLLDHEHLCHERHLQGLSDCCAFVLQIIIVPRSGWSNSGSDLVLGINACCSW